MISFIDNGSYSKDDLEKIHYGFEAIYIFFSKSLIIFPITYFLGILKYSLLFALFYGLLRTFSCGLHASKSWICTLLSLTIFIIIPYLCKICTISVKIKVFIGIFALIHFYLFAPADTKKRPIINDKKRKMLKFISCLFAIIYFVIAILIKNPTISNIMTYSLLLQSIIISPLSYKLFKLPYNNYKFYMKGGTI